MINSSDLRIGNLVDLTGYKHFYKIVEISDEMIADLYPLELSIQIIEMTELKHVGTENEKFYTCREFELENSTPKIVLTVFKPHDSDEYGYTFKMGEFSRSILYFHELQNLIYYLASRELKIDHSN